MPLDPELLLKAAKVYEAAEPLEGEKPKEVYESHKKCAPGEFGMNKEGYAKLQQIIKSAVDVTRDPQIENLVRNAPQDPSVGYARKLMPERSYYANEIAHQQDYNDYGDINAFHNLIAKPVLKGIGGLVGGPPGQMSGQVLGAGLHTANTAAEYIKRKKNLRNAMNDDMTAVDYQNKMHSIRNPAKPTTPAPVLPQGQPQVQPPKPMPPRGTGMGALQKKSAVAFGRLIGAAMGKQADAYETFVGPHVFTPGRTALMGAGAGGLGGAGLGGLIGALHGAISPGDTNDYDEKGKVKGLRKRDRLSGALRGLGAGGLIGGLAGAGLGAGVGAANADIFERERILQEMNSANQATASRVDDAVNTAKQKWDEARKSWGF